MAKKQGIYQLRLSAYRHEKHWQIWANPVQIWQTNRYNQGMGLVNPKRIINPHILESLHSICTKSVLIRFQNQTIWFDQIAVFQAEIPQSNPKSKITIRAELMFSNAEYQDSDKQKIRLLNHYPKLQCIGFSQYEISNPLQPSIQYLPILFENKNFCLYQCIVGVFPIGYKISTRNSIEKLFKQEKTIQAQIVRRVRNNLFFYAVNSQNKIFQNLEELFCTGLIQDKYQKLQFQWYNKDILAKRKDYILDYLEQDLKSIRLNFFQIYNLFIHKVLQNKQNIIDYYKKKYHVKLNQKFKQYIIFDVKDSPEIQIFKNKNKSSKKKIKNYRKSLDYSHQSEQIQIRPLSLFQIRSTQIFFIVQNSQTQPALFTIPSLQSSFIQNIHILILVHGYGGRTQDMLLIKAYISQIYPDLSVYIASSIEQQTTISILTQGSKLADQIKYFIYSQEIHLEDFKISFLCHSMGGLVVRAALPHLSDLQNHMKNFITLSSPHLGISYFSTTIFEFGACVIGLYANSISLEEMLMKDTDSAFNGIIHQLSQSEGLNWFQNLVFFSSQSDPFVVDGSARVQLPQQGMSSRQKATLLDLVSDFWKNVDCEKLMRIEVCFEDSLVGKSFICFTNRHIDFLDNPYLIKMLCYAIPQLFYN